jgi:DNA-binding XRE family transcriptional regulator
MASPEDPLGNEQQFAVHLRGYRERAGMTQAEVAEAMQDAGYGWIHQQTIDRIEKGQQRPRLGVAVALARIVGAELADLLRPPQVVTAAWQVLDRVRDVLAAERGAKRAAAEVEAARSRLAGAISLAEDGPLAGELSRELAAGRHVIKHPGER